MKIQHLDFKIWFNEAMKNPALKAEYDRQKPEFAVIRALIEARMKNGLSQKELADKIGTKQSVISRLESGNANPSIKFLQRIAKAIDSNLQIRFVRINL